jgi:hypothetical protein
MYEIHDNTESFIHAGQFDAEQDLPEPLDHWSLRDFADIVPIGGNAS